MSFQPYNSTAILFHPFCDEGGLYFNLSQRTGNNQPATGATKGQCRWRVVAGEERVDDYTTAGNEQLVATTERAEDATTNHQREQQMTMVGVCNKRGNQPAQQEIEWAVQ